MYVCVPEYVLMCICCVHVCASMAASGGAPTLGRDKVNDIQRTSQLR